ncbi:hypothetical protein [Novilysobacter defluvii]|uniref:Uncharacterized protein n=1 Tax=Lysobacter defluvii IMMIB APB-9 = DSM 18482 TaxID=1385515 RepID=A0A0A0M5H5_9GAMM|nr:hypothetical protein [Lysobacter defluvii]KGO98335.1 hypothetical protein N791_03075 [Lysobacter defluvii IMMIB APB-9 = DSM 18482]
MTGATDRAGAPARHASSTPGTGNTVTWLVLTTTVGFLLVIGSLSVDPWQLRVAVAGMGMLSLLAGLLLVLVRTPRGRL